MNENAKKLEIAVITTLALDGLPTEQDILDLAGQLRTLPPYRVSDEDFNLVIRKLKESLRIDMGLGSRVVLDHAPWLMGRKASIEPYFWTRYSHYLLKEGMSPRVVTALDKVGDDILDLLGNPADVVGWPRRGLVMGDVQSGKTSNYTGLICKAGDAEYRLIILLTGTLESLRRQTQGRLDAGFVGLDSAGVVTRNRTRRDVGVGLINAARSAGVFTSTKSDFKEATANQLGFRLNQISEPVLLVVKKNSRILENLTAWLTTYNANQSGTIDVPMLLIDDEADNASVNTNPAKATAINAGIRKLLKIFPRSSYLGFTATPFANVFINPDSTDEMLGNDLFPRDFIYALEAPTNYVGANLLFGDDSPLDVIRKIDDAEDFFPRGHKSNWKVDGLPDSMLLALRTFLLVNVIMDGRNGMPKHRSMLVNVSHFTSIQDQVRDELMIVLKKMQEDIRNYSGLTPREAEKNTTIALLKQTWASEFGNEGTPWKTILSRLNDSTQPIEVRSINQKSGAGSLDYAVYGATGLRVVAVGGNSLSRGLTLEGLCISYFYRNTQMYDTLMQMGRWFGYRDGYVDIFRIWMSKTAINWYGHISEASEELRREIRWMQGERLKPSDFGLKVRADPDSLLVTARNKMRNSQEITRMVSVSNRLIETTRLYSDPERIKANFNAVVRFLRKLDASEATRDPKNRNPLWRNVPPELVAELLESFIGHPLNPTFQPRDLATFVRAAQDSKMKRWDLVVPSGEGNALPADTGIESVLRQKRNLEIDKDETQSMLVSGKKMRVGSRGVEREGLSKDEHNAARHEFETNPEYAEKKSIPDHLYRIERSRPLLMLHFIEQSGDDAINVPVGVAICALGLSFPKLEKDSEMVSYRVNLVELRNMLEATDTAASLDEDDNDDDA